MSFIPKALIRRMYRKGSLRAIEEGVAFDVKNILGPGIITRINFIKVNNQMFNAQQIFIDTNGKIIKADSISPDEPILFTFGQKGTCILSGQDGLLQGKNLIELEVESREAGLINLTVTDNIQVEI